jgi:hypothetical protein
MNFQSIQYLKTGTARQRKAYTVLERNGILQKLRSYSPILAGTIPLNIDIEESDLDILCCFSDVDQFVRDIRQEFSACTAFKIRTTTISGHTSVVAVFFVDDFAVEVFGQGIPTTSQMAYRHLVIEHKILTERGEQFREKIVELKRSGYKTEPAFAKLLGLDGDPWQAILGYEDSFVKK